MMWKRFGVRVTTDGEVAEIIANAALTTFTNFFNIVAGTEIDFPVVPSLASGVRLSRCTARPVLRRGCRPSGSFIPYEAEATWTWLQDGGRIQPPVCLSFTCSCHNGREFHRRADEPVRLNAQHLGRCVLTVEPNTWKPKAFPPATSQPFEETNPISSRRMPRRISAN